MTALGYPTKPCNVTKRRNTYYAVYEDVLTREVLQFASYQDREDWLKSSRELYKYTGISKRASSRDPEVRRAIRARETVWLPHCGQGRYCYTWPFDC